MAGFAKELLSVARALLKEGRGRPSSAAVRRSISTSYYALFHFLLDEVAKSEIGTGSGLAVRRRIVMRNLSHKGIKTAFLHVEKRQVKQKLVGDFLASATGATVEVPLFVQTMAMTFVYAQAQRHDADYNLNAPFSKAMAISLHERVTAAIDDWCAATSVADKDFKRALCLLLLLEGKLRTEG